MDLTIGLEYLAEWGISTDTINRFEENKISLELMKCMKLEELKELVPNIRERILFRSGLEQLCKIIDDTSSEAATGSDIDNDVISMPSSPARASSVSSCNENPGPISENPRMKRSFMHVDILNSKHRLSNINDLINSESLTVNSVLYDIDNFDEKKQYSETKEIDLKTILNDNNHGKLVLSRLRTANKLDATFRAHLTKSIVEWYLKHYECTKKEDFVVIAEAIQKFIPTELKETYYIPGLKYNNKYRPAKGKLIDRYNNQSRLLKREGVLGRKRKLEIENIQEHSDIEEDKETVVWLQYYKEPFHEVKDKWLKTRKYRIETDYKNAKHNLQDILKKYPLLKQSFGFQLH